MRGIPFASGGFDVQKSWRHKFIYRATPSWILALQGDLGGGGSKSRHWPVSHSSHVFTGWWFHMAGGAKKKKVTHDEMIYSLCLFVSGGAAEVQGAGGRWAKSTTERQRESAGEAQAAFRTAAARRLPNAHYCSSTWSLSTIHNTPVELTEMCLKGGIQRPV